MKAVLLALWAACLVAGCAEAESKHPATQQTDAELRAKILGKWRYAGPGNMVHGIADYGTDGKVTYSGTIARDGKTLPFTAIARYAIDAGRITQVVESSAGSIADLWPVGTTQTSRIIRIMESEFEYVMANGGRESTPTVETRVKEKE